MYGTTYLQIFVDRKVFLRKVSDLEEIADKHAQLDNNSEMKNLQKCYEQDTHVPIKYTRTLN